MSVIEGVAPHDLRKIDDGHKPIPDSESPELDMASDTEPEQPNSFRSDEDPESPELEMLSDTEPEQPFCLISDDGVRCFSHLREMLNFMSKSDNQTDGDNQIDRGKQMVIDEGESQSSSTKSRKRKRTTPCCTCPQSPAKTEEPPLPEGYGYVPYAPCVDENDRYCPQFTNRIGYMCCSRCGVKGDHWPPFCRNPVNDLPGGASNRFSWKYYLRNFDLDEYLEKQRREAEVKAMNSKSDMSRKCIHCRNKTRAETEVSAFPVGYGKPKPDARKKVLKVNGFLRCPSRSALIRLMFQ